AWCPPCDRHTAGTRPAARHSTFEQHPIFRQVREDPIAQRLGFTFRLGPGPDRRRWLGGAALSGRAPCRVLLGGGGGERAAAVALEEFAEHQQSEELVLGKVLAGRIGRSTAATPAGPWRERFPPAAAAIWSSGVLSSYSMIRFDHRRFRQSIR